MKGRPASPHRYSLRKRETNDGAAAAPSGRVTRSITTTASGTASTASARPPANTSSARARRFTPVFTAPPPAFAAPPAFATGFGSVNPAGGAGHLPPVPTPAGPAFTPALHLPFTPLAGVPPALPTHTPSRKGPLLATVCICTAVAVPFDTIYNFCIYGGLPESYSTKLLGAAILVAVAMLLDFRAVLQYLTPSGHFPANLLMLVALRLTLDVFVKCHFDRDPLTAHFNKLVLVAFFPVFARLLGLGPLPTPIPPIPTRTASFKPAAPVPLPALISAAAVPARIKATYNRTTSSVNLSFSPVLRPSFNLGSPGVLVPYPLPELFRQSQRHGHFTLRSLTEAECWQDAVKGSKCSAPPLGFIGWL